MVDPRMVQSLVASKSLILEARCQAVRSLSAEVENKLRERINNLIRDLRVLEETIGVLVRELDNNL